METHVDNINFFTNYLVYYEPLKKLDEAKSGDVWMFLQAGPQVSKGHGIGRSLIHTSLSSWAT